MGPAEQRPVQFAPPTISGQEPGLYWGSPSFVFLQPAGASAFKGETITNEKMKTKDMVPGKNFKCKQCGMRFDNMIRLERHHNKAHPPKSDRYTQKWYWEN